MVYIGLILFVISVYLLVKRYDPKTVLLGAGIIMCLVAGNPMAAFNAFADKMVAGGLIKAVCSVMGFSAVLTYTTCDKHLVRAVSKGLSKMRAILLPAATIATFLINIALPSASGVAASVGAIFIPILISAGIHPAAASSAVLAGCFGSMLNPGLSHNPMVGELAGTDAMAVINNHFFATVVCMLIAAVSIAIVSKIRKEDRGYVDEKGEFIDAGADEKVKPLFAIAPIIPITLLILIPKLAPDFALGVPQAMVIGSIIVMIITKTKPDQIVKSFFEGAGKAYMNVMSIIIAAAVFVAGLQETGLIDAAMNLMLQSKSAVKFAATFGPLILGVVVGSGDSATLAFNEAITPFAENFGMSIMNMGSLAILGGALGRSMSPLTAGAIVCASLGKVNSMELMKRNAPGMLIAAVVGMFILTM